MKIYTRINNARRKIMRGITGGIGTTKLGNGTIDPSQIKRVLICRPNARLGNLLLITPLIQEVETTFPNCRIDIFVKGNLAPIVFKNYKQVDTFVALPQKPFKALFRYAQTWLQLRKNQYDIAINIDKNSSSGRLSTQFARAKYKFFGDEYSGIHIKKKDYGHMAKFPVYNFRDYAVRLGLPENQNKMPLLNLKLNAFEITEGAKILHALNNNNRKTICLFTFATGNKCYSEIWWEHFYENIKIEYPSYNIIEVLPMHNVSQISFKAPTFYSKNVRQIAALVANTEAFIGADSGIMHLASASLTPTIGLFSVTNAARYSPYGNNSIAINTNESGNKVIFGALNRILMDNFYLEKSGPETTAAS